MICTRLNNGFPFGLNLHFFSNISIILYYIYYIMTTVEVMKTASEIFSHYYMNAPKNQANDTNLSEKYVVKQSRFNVANRERYTVYDQNAI